MNNYEDGQIIAWLVYDESTKELVLICNTRSEARQIAEECCGRVAVVKSSH
jgi:hypothetical protein